MLSRHKLFSKEPKTHKAVDDLRNVGTRSILYDAGKINETQPLMTCAVQVLASSFAAENYLHFWKKKNEEHTVPVQTAPCEA